MTSEANSTEYILVDDMMLLMFTYCRLATSPFLLHVPIII